MTACNAGTSQAGQIGNDASPHDLSVRWPVIERQVLSALAAVGERGAGRLPPSRPCNWQHRDADYFSSQLDLLGNTERVIDLDAEVANRAFELCVPEEQLDGS